MNNVKRFAANPGEVTSGFGGIEYMDELTPDICKIATVGDTTQLIDWRDRKPYWVAKLKDNNCWMTQNLDYDDPNSTRRIGDTKPDAWPNENGTRQYWDPGEKIISGSTLANATTTTDRHLLVGNYYSYLSATSDTGSSATTDGANASGSICPGGWKLPTSKVTTNGSFGGLLSGLGTGATWANAITSAPYYFVSGGGVWSGTLYSAGDYGYYWSSTANDSDRAYILNFSSSRVNPSDYVSRYAGQSVRCLVQGS